MVETASRLFKIYVIPCVIQWPSALIYSNTQF